MGDRGDFIGGTDAGLGRPQALSLLADALAACPSAAVLSDDRGRIVLVNPAFADLSGYGAEHSVGREVSTLGAAPGADACEALWAALADRQAWQGDCLLRRRDGSHYIAAVRTVPLDLPGADGPLGLTYLHDVSRARGERAEIESRRRTLDELLQDQARETDQARRTSQLIERFARLTADHLPGSVCYVDSDFRVRFANRRFLEWTCLTMDQAVGRTVEQVLPERSVRVVLPYIQGALRGEPQSFVREVLLPEGARRWMQAHYLPDVRDGQVRGFFSLVTDIDEVKRAELQLQEINAQLSRARDKADEANRAKSVFLANMSHEIRTPMNAIIGLIQLMQRDNRDPLQRDRLARAAESTEHLMQVINDILDLSRIESGKLVLEQVDFSLLEVLACLRGLVEEQARARKLALEIDASQAPDELRGDPTRLTQALLNLVGNAVKFTHEGSVTLRVAAVQTQDERLRLRCDVIDTGIGIAQDAQQRIFEAFEQADGSTTRRFGGTGLGLAITRRLVEAMGGTLGVRSEPGQGSHFWFEVWLGRAGAAPVPASQPGDPAQDAAGLRRAYRGARVLLAEDHPMNQLVALELLRSAGMSVDLAADGHQAVDLAGHNAYDLILMDMQMPRLDGLEATRAIRALPAHGGTPILAMTANAFAEDRAACLDAGMNDHLPKPIDVGRLYAALARWLPHAPRRAGLPQGLATSPLWDLVPGLDTRRAMQHLGGRLDVYMPLLRQFIELYRQGLPALHASLRQGERAKSVRLVHSFQGACGMIGAEPLAEEASRLREALDAGLGLPEAVRRLVEMEASLTLLVQALDGALAEPGPQG
jgi:two-component system, sensor histidine kinase and response regulator